MTTDYLKKLPTKTISITGLFTTLLFLPSFVFAQDSGSSGLIGGDAGGDLSFGNFVSAATQLIEQFLIPLMIALCVLAFIYGVYKYFILGSSEEDKRTEGRSLMLYALLGFVAIVALWGIVGFLVSAFGFGSDQDYQFDVPGVPGGTGGGGGNGTDNPHDWG